MDVSEKLVVLQNELASLKQEYYPLLIEIRAFIMEAHNPVNMYSRLIDSGEIVEDSGDNNQSAENAKVPGNTTEGKNGNEEVANI